jgi:Concanavalin A-like lectin/glucanases superfamily
MLVVQQENSFSMHLLLSRLSSSYEAKLVVAIVAGDSEGPFSLETSAFALDPGQWLHLALLLSDPQKQARLYVDTHLLAKHWYTKLLVPIVPRTPKLLWGTTTSAAELNGYAARAFRGSIDEVAVHTGCVPEQRYLNSSVRASRSSGGGCV